MRGNNFSEARFNCLLQSNRQVSFHHLLLIRFINSNIADKLKLLLYGSSIVLILVTGLEEKPRIFLPNAWKLTILAKSIKVERIFTEFVEISRISVEFIRIWRVSVEFIRIWRISVEFIRISVESIKIPIISIYSAVFLHVASNLRQSVPSILFFYYSSANSVPC